MAECAAATARFFLSSVSMDTPLNCGECPYPTMSPWTTEGTPAQLSTFRHVEDLINTEPTLP